MSQTRANKNRKLKKRPLILPKCYESLPTVPKTNANVFLHGYPGGIRHEKIDVISVLTRYGFQVSSSKYGFTAYTSDASGEIYTFFGETIGDLLLEMRGDYPDCGVLYHHVCRDPLEQVRCYVESEGLPLTAEQYLFQVVGDAHREQQLTVSRIYRRLLGKSVDLTTKWSQSERYGDGYVAWKYELETTEDVYHVGAGSWYGQTFRGIKTTGKVRCVDPQRDGVLIETLPKEKVCVSDCSYGDGLGMSNVEYFYSYYEKWIKAGKQVYFKGDLCRPPSFPCRIVSSDKASRPHNREFIGYADNTITTTPDYEVARIKMSKANAVRNSRASLGVVPWPSYDKERVESLLCGSVGYHFTIPDEVNIERKVCGTARHRINAVDFFWRVKQKRPAAPFNGVTNSVIVWLFEQILERDCDTVKINIMDYPFFVNHQFAEECLWSFEECTSRLGLTRDGHYIVGQLTEDNQKNYNRLVEKSAARH